MYAGNSKLWWDSIFEVYIAYDFEIIYKVIYKGSFHQAEKKKKKNSFVLSGSN